MQHAKHCVFLRGKKAKGGAEAVFGKGKNRKGWHGVCASITHKRQRQSLFFLVSLED
jgi:hypothetical protein